MQVYPGSPDYIMAVRDKMIVDRIKFSKTLPVSFNISNINNFDYDNMTFQMMIHGQTLLQPALSQEITKIESKLKRGNAWNIKMVCRLIDERYPDYDNVIPSDNSNNVTISKPEILGSLKRISIYANKTTNQVRFKISGSEILISAEDLDFSNEANERISCDHDGDDIEIGFNAKFLIEMLSNIESDKVILKLSEPNRAGLLIPEDINDNEDITMLVMPVMLNDNA